MRIVETLAVLVAAAAIILAVAFLFLTASIPHAQAASCVRLKASWYGSESGNRTASGTYFDGSQMIVAHRSWKFGTKVRITYKGRSVDAVVRDRGPARWTGRDIDLSRAVAARIGMIGAGVAIVSVCRV